MKDINVSAERDYTVSIGGQWESLLIPLIQERTRVAVIISSSYSPDLTALQSLDCELHVFEEPVFFASFRNSATERTLTLGVDLKSSKLPVTSSGIAFSSATAI